MSGYDPATGVYELTATTAREWFQRLTDHKGATFMERISGILVDEGLEVLSVTDSFMLVRARQGAIWTALSGKPYTGEDPEHVTERRRYAPGTSGSSSNRSYPPRPSTSSSPLLGSCIETVGNGC